MSIFKNIWVMRIIYSVIAIIINFCIYQLIRRIVFSRVGKGSLSFFNSKKGKTYSKMFKSIIRYFMIIVTVLVILQIFGVNISSMLAGVGIIGIVIGFAIQDALKDIIKGFDILSDNYYNVGDVIEYDGNVGQVLAIGLKTTRIKDIRTFNIVSIANRNIDKVEIVSDLINIDVPLPYEMPVEESKKVLSEIVEKLKKIEGMKNAEYRGVNEMAESAINYQIKVYCNPADRMQMRRNSLSCIMEELNKRNISVPYNQLDIHQK